ncbi:MAG: polysaccharide deacetylase family protein [Actinomycetota bacterium]|nr:polysaccharide deacetylase family protein [Actinomycetota bacterium]
MTQPRRRPRTGRTLTVLVLVGAMAAALLALALPSASTATAAPATARTLVLYDKGGEWGWLGEIYAQVASNLAGHFGTSTAKPVVDYRPGDMDGYTGVIYIGSTYDESLPASFLDDVLAGGTPTMWLGANIWELHNRAAADDVPGFFADRYGWQYKGYDPAAIDEVVYKGRTLDRNSAASGPVMDVLITDPAKMTVLAQAKRANGTAFPWAVRSGNLTYIGEVPFSYPTESDRYLIVSDLLFDLLAPATTVRHRALVRIEDVSPASDPANLRALADVLHKRRIPFSVGVIPLWVDPLAPAGAPKRLAFADRPEVVAALKYMSRRGGTLIAHGYTHQYKALKNPFNGRTGTDYEFFQTRLDEDGNAVLVGPVAVDSRAWATKRANAAIRAMVAAGLPRPTIWETPHYTASAVDYEAFGPRFDARYERDLLFSGYLTGNVDTSRFLDQYFPYEVVDVYGSTVLPENLGHLELDVPVADKVLPAELVRRAAAQLVVRDGIASFFMHSFYEPSMLAKVVDGIEGLGYTFVSPAQVLKGFGR